MIVLSKIAARYWAISEREKRVNRCTSKMAVLCSISVIWRNLCRSNGNTRQNGRYRDVEIQAVDIILEAFNLLTLVGCNDIERVIKYRISQKEGKEIVNYEDEADSEKEGISGIRLP